MSNIEKMMNRIAALLAKAESTTFEEEAASYRAKAEELMRTYRIAEEELLRDSVAGSAPIWKDIPITAYQGGWDSLMISMLWNIAQHCGVRFSHDVKRTEGGYFWVAEAVGFEIDLRLAEMIFTAARLAFIAKMEPEFDPTLPAAENIYRLRSAGIDRQKIAKLVFGQEGHSQGIRVGRIYAEECEKRGEVAAASGRGFNRSAYRDAYADAFRATIRTRLQQARDAADASGGGAVVLPKRAEHVNEAFYVKNPWARPETPEAKAAREARMQQKTAEASTKVDRRRSAWTKADEANWERRHGARAQAAREAGASAARSVDLTRSAPGANRAEAAPTAPALEG